MNSAKELHVYLVGLIEENGQDTAIRYLINRFGMSYRDAVQQVRPAYLEAKGKKSGKRND